MMLLMMMIPLVLLGARRTVETDCREGSTSLFIVHEGLLEAKEERLLCGWPQRVISVLLQKYDHPLLFTTLTGGRFGCNDINQRFPWLLLFNNIHLPGTK